VNVINEVGALEQETYSVDCWITFATMKKDNAGKFVPNDAHPLLTNLVRHCGASERWEATEEMAACGTNFSFSFLCFWFFIMFNFYFFGGLVVAFVSVCFRPSRVFLLGLHVMEPKTKKRKKKCFVLHISSFRISVS
jgi:hypothetical protein